MTRFTNGHCAWATPFSAFSARCVARKPGGGPPGDQRWWILYTRAGKEMALAKTLQEQRISFYLPLARRGQLSGAGRQRGFRPLFPRYMFLLASQREMSVALASRCICRVLPVDDQHQLHHDLFALHRLIETGAPLCISANGFVGTDGCDVLGKLNHLSIPAAANGPSQAAVRCLNHRVFIAHALTPPFLHQR